MFSKSIVFLRVSFSDVRAWNKRKHVRHSRTLYSCIEILLNSLEIVTVTKELKRNPKEDKSRWTK